MNQAVLPTATPDMPVCALCNGRGYVLEGRYEVECVCHAEERRAEGRRGVVKALTGRTRISPAAWARAETFTPRYPAHSEALAAGERWLAGETPFLVLVGPHGVGKTRLAQHLLRRVVEQQATEAYFVEARRLALAFRADSARMAEVIRHMERVPVLALDDLDRELIRTPAGAEVLLSVVDTRYDAERRTIITTNANPDEYRDALPALASRLLDKRYVERLVFWDVPDLRQEEHDDE